MNNKMNAGSMKMRVPGAKQAIDKMKFLVLNKLLIK